MTEDIKQLAVQFYAAIDADQMRDRPAIVAPAITVHQPGMPAMDWSSIQQFGQTFYAAFPDLRHEIVSQVAEGDQVVNQLAVHGTHLGEFQGIPPTGKAVTVAAISIQRFDAGQLVEQHLLIDSLGMMQQLGVLPAPGQVAA